MRPCCYAIDVGNECASEVNQDHMSRQRHTSTESGYDKGGESVSWILPSPSLPPLLRGVTMELPPRGLFGFLTTVPDRV